MFQAANPLLAAQCDGRTFRLIGIGVSDLVDAADADLPDLAEPERRKTAEVERAMDAVRAKLGKEAITKGRAI